MTLSKQQLDSFRLSLEQRRGALGEELHEDAARSREDSFGALAGPAPDTGDAAVADLISDLDHAEMSRDLGELREVEGALERLAAGDYGLCVKCGAEIPLDRLRAQPMASRCVECQRVREKTYAGALARKI